MPDLTPRQSEVLRFIKDHMALAQRPPTRHDIARHFGFKSDNAAEEHLKALRRKGAIRLVPGTSRGIEVA